MSEPISGLIEWLRDYNEAPWRKYIRGLDERGQLITIDQVMVDAPAIVGTRFRCDTRTCAMVDREAGIESCCREYEVEITPAERDRIVAHSAEVIEFFSHHDPQRVSPHREISSFFVEGNTIELGKEDGRCAFSYRDAGGRLWCGLHSLALQKGLPLEALKPIACILFPLVVYRFESGEILLTSTSAEIEQLFEGVNESKLLPCLRQTAGGPMYEECRTGIEIAFGETFYQRLAASAQEYLAKH